MLRTDPNLTEDHWTVVKAVQDFYQQYQLHPTVRALIKKLSEQCDWGPERANSIYLHRLFPDTPITIASQLAGIPKPLKCI